MLQDIIVFIFNQYSSSSPDIFRRQKSCHPIQETIVDMTLHHTGLSGMLFDGSNSSYHSHENCHTKVVGVPRVVDKVLTVSIY